MAKYIFKYLDFDNKYWVETMKISYIWEPYAWTNDTLAACCWLSQLYIKQLILLNCICGLCVLTLVTQV